MLREMPASSATSADRFLVIEGRPEQLRRLGEEALVLSPMARLRDVDDRGYPGDHPALPVEHRSRSFLDPDASAIRPEELQFCARDRLAADRPGERPLIRPELSAIGIEAAIGLAPRDVVEGPVRHAQQRLEPVVSKHDASARSLRDHQPIR